MVNLAFLLLIFFMISATIAPEAPFDLALPNGPAGQDAGGDPVIYISASNDVVFGELRGRDDVFAELRKTAQGRTIEVRADGAVSAAEVAALFSRLSALGVAETRLVLVQE